MEEIKTTQISPLHGVRDAELRDQIAASMAASGWTGRPLIAYSDDEHHFQALTGSHRLAAAQLAGLAAIPVVVLTDDELAVLPLNGYGLINAEDAVIALRAEGMDELADLWDADNQ